MKPRQYKKLCKKAMDILVAGGMDKDYFSMEDETHDYKGKVHFEEKGGQP